MGAAGRTRELVAEGHGHPGSGAALGLLGAVGVAGEEPGAAAPAAPSSAPLGVPEGSPWTLLLPSGVDGFVLMAEDFFPLFLRMSLKRTINSEL